MLVSFGFQIYVFISFYATFGAKNFFRCVSLFFAGSFALRMVVCNILIDMCFIISVRKSGKFVIKVFQSCVNVIKGKFFFLKVVFRMV